MTDDLRARRIARARDLASQQGGVVSLDQLRGLGVTRGQIRANVTAERWRRVHSLVVALHTGPLGDEGTWWAAALEGGPRAYLDGASALIASGLKGFTLETIRVSGPPSARVRQSYGLLLRRTRRYDPAVVHPVGVPRARPDVAAVHAALWARTDKQAVLLVTMTVQQRLATAEQVGRALLRVRRDRRRRLLQATVLDLLSGVTSISESEFAHQCRRRGLPEPTRQVSRRGKDGTYFLDAYWEEWGVAVEVDGVQHSWATHVVADALRQNALTLEADVVLRLPLLGLRVAPDDFFDQIKRALAARGCPFVDDRVV